MEMKTNNFSKSLSLIICLLIFGHAGAQKHSGGKPNIIVIITDQQFSDAMSCRMGHQWINTPSVDRLAEQGVVFTRAYAANPLCAPSRNSIITGQYPHVTGIESNGKQNELYDAKDYFNGDRFKSLGTYFREGGYETAYFGKWHINFDPNDKEASGFDRIRFATGRGDDDSLPVITDRFLKQKHDTPFLLFLSFLNPHDVCEWSRFQAMKNGSIGVVPALNALPPLPVNFSPARNESDAMTLMRESYHHNLKLFPVENYTAYDWQRLRWGYYRLIEKVDSLIGKVLTSVHQYGYDDNTLILYTSDHGSCIGAHHFVQKTVFYDESSRVPFILKYNKRLKPSTNKALVNTGTDILPTLLDFAGIKKPGYLPGESLKATAETGAEPVTPFIVVENEMSQGGPVNGVIPVAHGRMVRSKHYKYCLFDLGKHREELYDMETDPYEKVNIAYDRSMQDIIKKMRSYLHEFAVKNKDTMALEMLKLAGKGHTYTASDVTGIYKYIDLLQPGDTLSLDNGIYSNIQLILKQSGTPGDLIFIKAKNPGKVFFTGDAKVELRGDYLVLNGICFKNGARDITQWESHGPGLVAVYGSHDRVTQCAFDAFDEANSAYITTSIPADGRVPQYDRIDHCSFVNKITFDQVINLNNSRHPVKKEGSGGRPMYHRVDHCFFSNPKKPGNAGGAIRIGYYRNDTGRCVVDSNVFMRQDSEPEIITGKSQQNVYYANTFLNCQGTLNFRHGDQQVAINNFFITTDNKYEYGGMFIWGSRHVVANNYFDLKRTIDSRGNAAVYLNPGAKDSEHALAFDILIVNNFFKNVNGYAINFVPLAQRREQFCKEFGYTYQFVNNITLKNNVFYSDKYSIYPFFKDTLGGDYHNNVWVNNFIYGKPIGINRQKGMSVNPFHLLNVHDHTYSPHLSIKYQAISVSDVPNIPGIHLRLDSLMNRPITGEPLTWKDAGPSWMTYIPCSYALSGKLPPEVQIKFKQVIERWKVKNNS
jgi:arylsulfatase A-like enzyme